MKRLALFGVLMSLAVVGVWACGDTDSTGPGEVDAGQRPGGDAGTTGQDSGTAGEDGGPIVDAGETTDAGQTADAGPGDAGTDAGNFEGVQCGATTCAVGDVCCVSVGVDGGGSGTCATSCPDGGGAVACDGPEDCSGKTCCGNVTETGTTPPLCTITGVAASCATSCTTSNMPPTQCTSSEVVLCHARADCAGQGAYTECCTFAQNGATTSFCVNTFTRGFASSCAP